jgi:hypothetical protein
MSNVVPIHTPEKPESLRPNFDNIPNELKTIPQWIVWRAEAPKHGKPKWPKIPYIAQPGKPIPASVAHPATWRGYDQGVKAYQDNRKWPRPYDGVGFVFSGKVGSDGLTWCGIDFDKINQQAKTFISTLNTYTEKSVSGRWCIVLHAPSLSGKRRVRLKRLKPKPTVRSAILCSPDYGSKARQRGSNPDQTKSPRSSPKSVRRGKLHKRN